MGFSLAFWFIVWELVGRARLSTIVPPVSRIVMAGITILPSDKFMKAAGISLRSFAIGMG
ncbi:MAG: ABC transporter permease, partial [candidate division NC10 bacterium]|nr:ABC transporter permease [candidate division NC10 bacterium]